MITSVPRDNVAWIHLEKGKVNALDLELLTALPWTLDKIEADPSSSAVVLTGKGSSFSAGVDLVRVLDGGAEYVQQFLPALDRAVERLFTFPKPVVAAVNGHAIAGGCILALACDRRIGAEGNGRLGAPELAVGVPFPALPLEILRFAVAPPLRDELLFGAGTMSLPEAHSRGLLDRLVPAGELEVAAQQAAQALAALPATAFQLTKHQLRRPAIAAWRAAQDDGQEARVMASWTSPATHSIIRAYLERTVGRK